MESEGGSRRGASLPTKPSSPPETSCSRPSLIHSRRPPLPPEAAVVHEISLTWARDLRLQYCSPLSATFSGYRRVYRRQGSRPNSSLHHRLSTGPELCRLRSTQSPESRGEVRAGALWVRHYRRRFEEFSADGNLVQPLRDVRSVSFITGYNSRLITAAVEARRRRGKPRKFRRYPMPYGQTPPVVRRPSLPRQSVRDPAVVSPCDPLATRPRLNRSTS